MSAANVTIAATLTHLSYLPYNYVPTEWICATLLTLFALSGLIHFYQALRYRLWFLLPTAVLANISEVIGWSARLWSSKSPYLLEPFIMQICTTIIAPTPLVAANFLIFGELVKRLGPQYSRLSPFWYAIVFIGLDIVALVVQAVGGAAASEASENHHSADPGGHIMLAGIVLQLVAIVVYMTLASEFIMRYLRDRPVRKISRGKHEALHAFSRDYEMMLFGLTFSTTCVFIRSVYRTCELSNGWTGHIISTQHLFSRFTRLASCSKAYTLLRCVRWWNDCSRDLDNQYSAPWMPDGRQRVLDVGSGSTKPMDPEKNSESFSEKKDIVN
ncbi:hypothetical protein NM688_g699 [Phlebia brevispora]|uniref:Uncharacterized protein n=1 Tax=Phlebia brevispora TaxID=194682 RepID=A0ACC1TDZ5_9APHY|nr:hypothetical protein NM688_g699 [Phlebia brevispora]